MILIDLPMPEACDVCPMNYDFGYCLCFENRDDWEKYSKDWNSKVCERKDRPEYCPLKEQEARVMTLEEVKAFEWEYCYLEEERLPGKEYRKVCGDYALTCITWPCIASMRIQHSDASYGKKWRCWSAKPTDEQRQAVKWE